MQGAVGFLISIYLQIYQGIFQLFFKSVKIWQNYGHESVAPLVLAHPVYRFIMTLSYSLFQSTLFLLQMRSMIYYSDSILWYLCFVSHTLSQNYWPLLQNNLYKPAPAPYSIFNEARGHWPYHIQSNLVISNSVNSNFRLYRSQTFSRPRAIIKGGKSIGFIKHRYIEFRLYRAISVARGVHGPRLYRMSGFMGGQLLGQSVKCNTCHHYQVVNPHPAPTVSRLSGLAQATPPIRRLLHLFTCSQEDVI